MSIIVNEGKQTPNKTTLLVFQKVERPYSLCMRVCRVALGVILVLGTCFIALAFPVVRDLFARSRITWQSDTQADTTSQTESERFLNPDQLQRPPAPKSPDFFPPEGPPSAPPRVPVYTSTVAPTEWPALPPFYGNLSSVIDRHNCLEHKALELVGSDYVRSPCDKFSNLQYAMRTRLQCEGQPTPINRVSNPYKGHGEMNVLLTQYPCMDMQNGEAFAFANFSAMHGVGVTNILDLTNDADLQQGQGPIPYYPTQNNPNPVTFRSAHSQQSVTIRKISNEQSSKDGGFNCRKDPLLLEVNGQKVNLDHLHYFSWQDYKTTTIPIIIQLAERVYPLAADSSHPLAVHCRGGVGRAGTFTAILFALHNVKSSETERAKWRENPIKAAGEMVLHLKTQRSKFCVQTHGQLQCVETAGKHLACKYSLPECDREKYSIDSVFDESGYYITENKLFYNNTRGETESFNFTYEEDGTLGFMIDGKMQSFASCAEFVEQNRRSD